MIAIAPLGPEDRSQWEPLARGYKAFYETDLPDGAYSNIWARLIAAEEIHGLAALENGKMVGIAHFLFHATTWGGEICYLQDLFTLPEARGRGAATALIEAVAAAARTRGSERFYWMTKEGNGPARALYDRIARFKGFIRYDFPL